MIRIRIVKILEISPLIQSASEIRLSENSVDENERVVSLCYEVLTTGALIRKPANSRPRLQLNVPTVKHTHWNC